MSYSARHLPCTLGCVTDIEFQIWQPAGKERGVFGTAFYCMRRSWGLALRPSFCHHSQGSLASSEFKVLTNPKSFPRKAERGEGTGEEEAKHAHKSDSICCATACVNTGEKSKRFHESERANSNLELSMKWIICRRRWNKRGGRARKHRTREGAYGRMKMKCPRHI